VPVEGLFETRGSLNEFSELGRLHCNNAVIRTDGNPYILQHKIIIIDEEIVITSSLNFSSSSFGVNNGSALIIHNPAVAELYTAHWRQQFEQGEEIDPVEVDCSEYE
jgi:phosphatidylserine/phosphatidylglycerophosphate/cardiolipin synthase-like enzyme